MPTKTLTVEALWNIKRPSGLSLSPDASRVVCSLTSYSMESNSASSNLWLLSTFGGKPRMLTSCGDKDGQPQFSPRGDAIAFVAKRTQGGTTDQQPQLYVIDPDGGEARRVTTLATGVSALKWFPDGKRIAVVSWVWPHLKGDKAQAKRQKEQDDNKVKAHVVEHMPYRYWDHFIPDEKRAHILVVDVATGRSVDLFEGTDYELIRSEPDATTFDISPDGKHIAFSFDESAEKRWLNPRALLEIDVKTRKVRTLIESKKPAISIDHPSYSPDGTRIACMLWDVHRNHNAMSQVGVYERSSGKLTRHFTRWDREPNAPLQWQSNDTLMFAAEDQGRRHAWVAPLSAKEPTPVMLGGWVGQFECSMQDADCLVAIRDDMQTAPTVLCMRAGQMQPIEQFNQAVMNNLKLGEYEQITHPGYQGAPVQTWVIYPPNFDPRKKYPLMHAIHGGPHASSADTWHFRWNNQLFAAQGYVVLGTNYHGSSGYGQQFIDSITNQWGKRELADVEAATDMMLAKPFIDRNRLFATGGSYGGYIVAWMNGHLPAHRYNAYICHAGCYNWVSFAATDATDWNIAELGASYWDNPGKVNAQSPHAFAKNFETPTLVIHGALDYRVPDAQGLEYYNVLKHKGVPARMVWYPDENHWILKPQNSRLWYSEFFNWLERWDCPPEKSTAKKAAAKKSVAKKAPRS